MKAAVINISEPYILHAKLLQNSIIFQFTHTIASALQIIVQKIQNIENLSKRTSDISTEMITVFCDWKITEYNIPHSLAPWRKIIHPVPPWMHTSLTEFHGLHYSNVHSKMFLSTACACLLNSNRLLSLYLVIQNMFGRQPYI